jgi:ABC-type multidrug transport system fused ATPase/permease subunit
MLIKDTKEWKLRIKRNPFRFLFYLIIVAILFSLKFWLGMIFLSILFLLIFIDYILGVSSAIRFASEQSKKYPEGLKIGLDEEGFYVKIPNKNNWQKFFWHSYSVAFIINSQKSLILYDRGNKKYTFFFGEKMNNEDFVLLKNLVCEKIPKLY